MPDPDLHIVTGAFGYSGRHIAARLLEAGCRVRTLTNSTTRRHPFGDRIQIFPYHFDDYPRLVDALRGAAVLYNTYWVRFNYGTFTFAEAVRNTRSLFRAAREAGVGRVVHVSITNPSLETELEYFRGKAQLEQALRASGLSHAIVRPAVLFGGDDILINNIAWLLRRFPVFAVFGDGRYRLQPIHVDDLARLVVDLGRERQDRVVEAIGPETFTYRELVTTIGEIIGKRRPILSVPPALGYLAGAAIGRLTGDVMITRDEIKGLMAGLLYVDAPPAGTIRLTEWARDHADALGRRYASELARRANRTASYKEL